MRALTVADLLTLHDLLIQDHPFLDGNKRIGVLAMLTLLELNHCFLSPTDDDLIRLGLGVASGSISAEQVRDWIIETSNG